MIGITREPFGMVDGQPVELFTLSDQRGGGGAPAVRITNYGGIITSWTAPDRNGRLDEITLALDRLADYRTPTYLAHGAHFGALIGRYANRIAHGRFSIHGIEYQLAINSGTNNLHGGPRGFDKQVWRAAPEVVGDEARLILTYKSPDGDQGFPGRLEVRVTISYGPGNALRFDYEATTDRPTILNLTNHCYFNLAGEWSGDVLDTELQINAGRFTPLSAEQVPTGELRDVAGTAFDFRTPHPLGERMDPADPQIALVGGYDHNFVIDRDGEGLVPAARAFDARSGRQLEVLTTEPGIQLYTGNYLEGAAGRDGRTYRAHQAFCLETQHFPDSPNHPNFPTTVLEPGKTYRSTSLYRVSTR